MKLIEPIPTEESIATSFREMNRGYNSVFKSKKMSIGLVAPLEHYNPNPVPTMERHLERVRLAEQLGFAAVWLRDVPFHVASFGDAGQTFDPFVYLGYLAAATDTIALGVSSIVLPLRHPAHVAKAAASVDVLSGGRLILGVASGDRPDEYPAMGECYEDRGERFRAAYDYIRRMGEDFPKFGDAHYGQSGGGINMLPKPTRHKLPLLITGGSQQSPEWLAQNGDGWMIYPKNLSLQYQVISQWRQQITASGMANKPVMQPLHIDLDEHPSAAPYPIHLGFHLGIERLISHLRTLRDVGVNHVALNLRFNQLDTEATMKYLADALFPEFHLD